MGTVSITSLPPYVTLPAETMLRPPIKDTRRLSRRLGRLISLLAGGLALLSGCAHAPEVDTMVHEAPKGSVYLERIPDRGFKAAHPIAIEEGLIARTLGGVMVTERKTTFQTAFSKQPATARAFSEEDIRFLAPFLTTALRQAAADQQVGFQVRS